MRLFFYIAIGLGIIFFFQNCQEVGTQNITGNDGFVSQRITTEANLSDAAGITFGYPFLESYGPSAIEYQVDFTDFTLTIANATTGVNLACNLTSELQNRVSQLVERAQICRTQYFVPPDTVTCLAMATPFGIVNYSSKTIELVNGICSQDTVALCNEDDQRELRSIFSELQTKQDSFTCRQL